MKVFHIGFTIQALSKALSESSEYLFLDWTSYTAIPNNTKALHNKIAEICDSFQPELTLIQIQAPNILDSDIVNKIPGIVINWTWDFNPRLDWIKNMNATHVIHTFTNEEHVNIIRSHGMNAEFLQSGFNDEAYKPTGSISHAMPRIVFIANNYPKDDYQFPLADYRIEMVDMLEKKYGDKFGVFGFGWKNSTIFNNFMYREGKEAECYRSCDIAINLSHYEAQRYTSDRMLRLMGSGAFCLSKWYPGIDIDFVDGEHLVTWRNFDELCELIERYSVDYSKRLEIAQNGCKLVHDKYTWKHFADNLKKLKEQYEDRRIFR